MTTQSATVDRRIVNRAIRLLTDRDDVSRNRNFVAFSPPDQRQAFRLFRLAASLEDEILAADDRSAVTVVSGERGAVGIKVENEIIRYTRLSFLPRDLFRCLAERLADRGLTLAEPLSDPA